MEKDLKIKSHLKRYLWCGILVLPWVVTGLTLDSPRVYSAGNEVSQKEILDRILQETKAREKNLKTLSGTFSQIKKTTLLKAPLKSEGRLYYEPPGKLLLRVTRPKNLILLLKNNRLYTYDPDLSSTEERYFGWESSMLRDLLAIGLPPDELKKRYDIVLSDGGKEDWYGLRLLPKSENIRKYIRGIMVYINPTHWLPEMLQVKEKGGDETTITFQFDAINKPLPEGVFDLHFSGHY